MTITEVRHKRGYRTVMAILVACATIALVHSAEVVPTEGRADFYVATNGNDAWSGRLPEPNAGETDGPFATLVRAQNAARALRKKENRGATVLVRGGTHLLKQTLQFGPEDSGTQERPLVFAAYPGEQPVVSGAVKIPGPWARETDGNVWTTRPPLGNFRPEEFYVNGVRQRVARMPNEGVWKARRIGTSKRAFGFGTGKMKNWPDIQSGVAVVRPYEWVDFHLRIRSVDEVNQEVTLAEDCGYEVVPENGAGEYYIENVRAALDQLGEWCFDTTTGAFAFWPPRGDVLGEAEVLVGRLPVLVSLDGNAAQDRWVEHIRFSGLTFRYSGRYERWRHYQGTALRLRGARSCGIVGCRFEDLGGSGIVLWKECRESEIFGNEFTRTGDTPVVISDYLSEGPAMSYGNVVENNYIHHCGTVRKSIAGIELSMTGGNRIAHNLIHDMPYLGIRLSGTRTEYWSPKNAPSLAPPYTEEKIKPFIPSLKNVIEKNHIHHVMQELHDGGGIYFWGVMGEGANIIRGNLVHHVGQGRRTSVGIYLDDNCDDVLVHDNIVYSANFGLHLHGAPRNFLENNVFAYSQFVDISVQPEKYNLQPMNSVLRRNIFYRSLGRVFLDTSWAAWEKQPIGEMNHNLYWRGGQAIPLGQGNFEGFDKDSVVADPLFVDPERGAFRLRENSPAFDLGIKAISMEQVGPQPKPLNAFKIPEISSDARAPILPAPGQTQTIVPARTFEAVTVDGILDEKTWKDAAVHVMKKGPDKDDIAGQPCRLQAAYDNACLYISLTVPVKDAKRLRRGGQWGADDGAEVCLQVIADNAGPIYVVHGFANGASESVTEAGAPDAAAKEFGRAVKFAARIHENLWTAEWAVPWEALKFKPVPGAKLRFNSGVWRSETREWIQWAGTGGATWQVEQAGLLEFQ
jgi:hypothetical protein